MFSISSLKILHNQRVYQKVYLCKDNIKLSWFITNKEGMSLSCSLYNEWVIIVDIMCTIGVYMHWGQGVICVTYFGGITPSFYQLYLAQRENSTFIHCIYILVWICYSAVQSVTLGLVWMKVHENSCESQFVNFRLYQKFVASSVVVQTIL